MKKLLSLMVMVSVAGFLVVGCGKKADTNKSIEQIQKEVTTMTVKDLESTAKAYAKEIEAKKTDVDKVKAKLKDLSPKELLGEGAKSIKDEITTIGNEVKALTDRYEIYAKEFTAKGGNMSAVKIG